LDDDNIDDIKYQVADGTKVDAPKAHRARFKAAVGYYHYVDYYYDDDTNKLDVLVTPSISLDSFEKFVTREFDLKRGIVRYTTAYVQELELIKARIEKENAEKAKILQDTNRASKLPPPETAADRFNRGIKRDPAQFKTFQNEL
jgi:hypothetical protein